MLFNSYIFVLAFLPIALAGYYLWHALGLHRIALVWLSLASFVFYAYDNTYYLMVLVASILVNWFLSLGINRLRDRENPAGAKTLMILGIVANIASIFYFKYYDFFIENFNLAFGSSFNLRHVVLPLGISFFTFQQVSYLVDTYKGETADYSFIEYMAFVSFFPQLVAGPIVLHGEIIPQFRDPDKQRFDSYDFGVGLTIFGIGMFKKVYLADTFGNAVNWTFSNLKGASSLELALTMLAYTFQIYFDFSGYCDMAIGIGRAFRLKLPVNFDSPYKSLSMLEFWKRWHMTLTRFLRNYVYIPLGGNRKGKARTYLNIMIVFLISGLWHGANWTFILWGLLHGLLQVINRMGKNLWDRAFSGVRWIVTFVLVNFLWLLFRADSVSQAGQLITRMLTGHTTALRPEFTAFFAKGDLTWLLGLTPFGSWMGDHKIVYLIGFMAAALLLCLIPKNLHEKGTRYTPARAVFAALLLVWSITLFTGVSSFIYFNF